jgi:hypothetical protein
MSRIWRFLQRNRPVGCDTGEFPRSPRKMEEAEADMVALRAVYVGLNLSSKHSKYPRQDGLCPPFRTSVVTTIDGRGIYTYSYN